MPYKRRLPIEEMVRLYESGLDADEIGKMYGYKNGEYIRAKLRQAGVYKAKRLDRGKVFALYKAGWKVRDIALDLDTTDDVIKEVLKAL